MSYDRRRKNVNWTIGNGVSNTVSHSDAALAVMMDIRDEIQKLNRVFECPRFVSIPNVLREIRVNTREIRINTNKPKPRKRTK